MKPSEFIKKYGIIPNKRLDQHFLVDTNIVKKEVESAEIKKGEVILEVGPGFGLLTQEILKKTDKVVVIEKDKKMIEILKKEFPSIEIIEGDALKVDFPKFDKCVSNIPYSISSGIIIKLGELKKPSILLLQKEFARRLIAEPPEREYSRITVMCKYYFTPVLLKEVSKNSFFPRPKVDSAIIKLIPKRVKSKVINEKFFFLLLRALFSHKNQKVKNAFIHSRKEFNLNKEKAKSIELMYENKKVFELGLEELIELSNKLWGYLNRGKIKIIM